MEFPHIYCLPLQTLFFKKIKKKIEKSILTVYNCKDRTLEDIK